MGYFVATVPSGMLQSARLKERLAPVSKEPVFESIPEHDGAGFAYCRRHASSLDLRLLMLVFGSLVVFSVVIAAGLRWPGRGSSFRLPVWKLPRWEWRLA